MDYHSAVIPLPPIYFLALNTAAVTVLIFVALLLLFLSFITAGSEIAFFSLNNKDINILKTRKQPSYRRIVSLLEQPKTLLASMLISNALVNIAFILIANMLLDNWLPADDSGAYHWPTWLVFICKLFFVSTFLVLFAEIIPKVWAANHKIWFAGTASLIVEIFNSLFYNISKKLVRLNDRIEKRLTPESDAKMAKTNIAYAIDLLPEHEATSKEKQILKGIYKFGNTSVKQIMRTRMDVSGIPFNSSFEEIKTKVQELHYSRLPVYKNNLDEIAGMIHTKDLLPHIGEPAGFNWQPLMRTPYFVHEQKFIEDLLQEFRSKRVHFAIVVDEFGGTSGIVTLEDIMEEVIGDINDEFDDIENVNKKIDDYNYIFEGRKMINDACKSMGLSPDTFDGIRGDSDSVAGLVLEIAGEFPAVNQKFTAGDFTFTPLSISKNRIDKVQITINSKEAE